MLADKRAVRWIRLPWRHEPLARDDSDLRRVALRLAEGRQAEGRRTALVMAHRAAILNQRCDVLRVAGESNRRDRRDRGKCFVSIFLCMLCDLCGCFPCL